ncbi:MAG: DUF1365 domain-containing protein [Alphaproteobacteria bacterium]|nr:DUF1365 domain-containing protein [Alphaproteobacteria bacterium]
MSSALYTGKVAHVRLRPLRHRLRYRVAQGLFDLDELPALSRQLRLFGHNRAAPFSFHDRDHGDGTGDLRGWLAGQLAAAGLAGPWGRVRVLCMPRMFGFVFNPLSVWFCDDAQGRLAAVVYEVNNTFGDRHAYVLPAAAEGPLRQACEKAFHVSPFLPMALTYAFRLSPPEAQVTVAISAEDAEGPVLAASFAGERRPLTDACLARVLAAFPFMTLKVVAAIHWEALKLWVRGAPVFRPAVSRAAPSP